MMMLARFTRSACSGSAGIADVINGSNFEVPLAFFFFAFFFLRTAGSFLLSNVRPALGS
jgi:ABC-type multidrug transport system permease subunit